MLGLGLNIFTLAIRRYFGGGGGQFAGSSLNLDFTSGNQTLDPRITFTRASTGTRINASGVMVSEAIDGPRFDYDPVTLQPKGLLIEEQRTNSIRNNTMVGAVAGVIGSGGALPTNFSTFTSLTGLTREVVSVGTENGIPYIDFRLNGTPSGAGSLNLFFDSIVAAASQNQQWTNSSYVKLVGGSLAGVTSVQQVLIEYNSSFGFLTQGATNFTPESSGSLNALRVAYTRTLINASAAFTRASYQYNLSGAAIDFTLRIGLPQLELGAFATSVIPTSGTAATRAADVAVMTGANFSNWYNATTGAIFADYATMQQTGFPSIVSASDGTNTNRIQMSHVGANRRTVLTAGGVAVWDAQGGVLGSTASGVFAKFALAYENANYAAVVNGGTPAAQTSGTVPSGLNRLAVGADGASGNFLNGHIRRLAFFQRRLTSSELEGITK